MTSSEAGSDSDRACRWVPDRGAGELGTARVLDHGNLANAGHPVGQPLDTPGHLWRGLDTPALRGPLAQLGSGRSVGYGPTFVVCSCLAGVWTVTAEPEQPEFK
jgi:hypothetical protein